MRVCHPGLEEYLKRLDLGSRISPDQKGRLFLSIGKGDRLGDKAMSVRRATYEQAGGWRPRGPNLFHLM